MERITSNPAISIPLAKSPRHEIAYMHIPARKSKPTQKLMPLYSVEEYGRIIDATYEMADQIATSNGVTVAQAINIIMYDEKWKLLHSERKAIELILTT